MCNHHNLVMEEDGTSTCADCFVHFNKSLCSEFTSHYNGRAINLLKTKSAIITTLEIEFGINDAITASITEKIFNLISENNVVKGTKKKAFLCASLYYAYHYLQKPQNFKDMMARFKVDHKHGSKGLKLCQMAIQEASHLEEEIKKFKGLIHSYASTHKEKLEELLSKYNIPLKNYEAIEKIVIISHLKKNKILNDRINNLWVSCIFFWLRKFNPYLDPEDFIGINSDHTTLTKLKSDVAYLQKCNF